MQDSVRKKSRLSETDDYQQVGQSQVILTRKELSFEASLGHGVIWFELNTHTVELGCDRLWFLCATVFPMKLCICGQAAVNLNVIIFTNLQTDGHIALPLWSKDYLVLVTLLQVTHKVSSIVNLHHSLQFQKDQKAEWCGTAPGQ